ncbi:GntR family transcriptional regulator [Bacillus alveayuensis]|jgi:DNA-binding GntR family transcriptional regulator|uniref:DNA-binding GntR family transcriptional regulator n=1 Tax=Aeribacillus alveayuensis TaxID=279215 RepID=A0ABT9VQ14_9BACI|nr:GntR family transcriptional regulator [Bacillus alveayuensis]MDQ0163038.1 DNA-binding GntR family transcriptional regulator [Bacillus alveayuensis]
MDAYNFIKEAIIHLKYPPGMRLTEESLAKELNLSRTPIREAIKQLEAEGLVVPLKRGVKVRHFTKEDIKKIYDIRTLLESYAAGKAALYRTDENIAALEEANDLYEKAVYQCNEATNENVKLLVEANNRFHESIFAACRNEHLHFHLSKVVVIPLVFRSFYWYSESELQRSLDFHKIILKAIQDQEPDRARIAMHEHIYEGRDQVLKHLDKDQNRNLLKWEGK